ncbi:c-type cytochrome [Zobellia uliginosa]|uniref:c-type cytochrome n=1 Tax=Zobellia uliginosa TaxID=143224 RepID=UPI001C06C870|nr:c-type cytochrome [Zobellia uliginosa]MBU2946455.1 c-type cytochrome [Zobellia uliginosa]
MKKHVKIFALTGLLLFGYACSSDSNNYEPVPDPDEQSPAPNPEPEPEPILELDAIPSSAQRIGDVVKGYDFLINGNYMSSGVPYQAFVQGSGEDNTNVLERSGDNANIAYEYTAVDAANGVRIVSPNCMSCHAGFINNEFVVGLGNHAADFTINRADNIGLVSTGISLLYGGPNSDEWAAYNQFRKSIEAIGPKTLTKTRGANPADKITRVLAAHRDKNSLEWTDTPNVNVSDEVIPTDVPAWWLLKKKNAMFYHAIGRKDFCKSFIGSALLTLDDKTKAEELDTKMPDILAYIYSLEAPSYPFEIDDDRAAQGKPIFEENCVKCHGSYGDDESYPNLLVSLKTIGTDPALSDLYTTPSNVNDYFLDWFNTGWFGTGSAGLEFNAEGGYLAPPLDGVWATAPYFHNGSVATIAQVLDSSTRPKYWSRSFNSTDYDKENLGWNYTEEVFKTDKETYDTTLKGYGNGGHIFGDKLTNEQRLALLEYLKTL